VRPNHLTRTTLPANQHSFLTQEGPALLSAYYCQGEETILRIYEKEGQGGEVHITLDWTPAAAQAIDLTGQVIEMPVRVDGKRVAVTIKPWQIVTLGLTRG
jgi:hypothetical protein